MSWMKILGENMMKNIKSVIQPTSTSVATTKTTAAIKTTSAAIKKQQKDEVLQILLSCNANTTTILEMLRRLQLYDFTFSLRETARVLHVSKERVRQIQGDALIKIRHAIGCQY